MLYQGSEDDTSDSIPPSIILSFPGERAKPSGEHHAVHERGYLKLLSTRKIH
jgi:hypothetical protein